MANKFTFQTAIKLNSSNFKKGVNEVKSALAGLRNSFLSLAGALGAGLGFTQFISNIKNTAVQLSSAKNVLENVSKVTKNYTDGINKGSIEINNYAENLAYVKQLAKDYSQDLVTLIENFAQFHAACEKTNLGLEQQKLVFESLTKAAAFYHMSADRSRDMMNAITQMMSKGKVSAEELRRQLGNALPGAFNLMAAALGVTTAQLEDMMKKGQVVSSEALPKFAAMLNTVTKNADFDSIQMSMNRLKNTWYEFVEASGAEGVFKNLVDGADSLLSSVSNNISTIKSLIVGLITTILSYKLFTNLKKQGEEYYANQKAVLEKTTREFRKHVEQTQSLARKIRFSSNGAATPASLSSLSKKEIEAIIQYNDELIRMTKIQKELYGNKTMGRAVLIDDGDIAKMKALNAQLKAATTSTLTLGAKIKNAGHLLVGAFKGLAIQVKSILASMGAMAVVSAIIGGISAIINHVRQVKAEWDRINSIVQNYRDAVQETDTEVLKQATLLNSNLRILQDTSKSERERLSALKEINKMMGTNFGKDALDKTSDAIKKITQEVYRWIEATKLQAKIQVQAQKSAEAQSEIERLRIGLLTKENNLRSMTTVKGRDDNGDPVYGAKKLMDIPKVNKLKKEIQQNQAEIVELKKVVEEADKALDDLGVELVDVMDIGGTAPTTSGGGGGGDKTSDIEKVFNKFTSSKKELTNQLKEHAITQEEYNKEFDELVSKYWQEAAGTGKMSIDDILNKMDKGKTLTKMEQWYKELYDAAQKAAFNNTITAAAEALEKATDEAIDEADKAIREALEEWNEKIEKNTQADLDALLTAKPGKTKRDSTFDYNKTQSAIKGEQLDISNDYIKELEDAINTIVGKYDKLEDAADAVKKKLEEWRTELSLAKKGAATLEEAMRFAKIQEDIDEFKKAINEAAFGGVKNLANSLDRIIKGMETLNNVFEDTDSTGWEKFMAVFNELVQIIETIMSAYQTMMTIQEATTKMEEAEIALVSTKIALLEKELLLRQALAAQKSVDVKQTEAQAAANMAEAATAKAATSAKAGEAIAGATASGAKLAFPYNLVAIAAGIAAVLAALASMSKFANGGIVGGHSYSGDKQLARVNSGEMVLNKAQQANLWSIINGKSKGGGGQVEFKIKGSDLVGTLNNYNRLRK